MQTHEPGISSSARHRVRGPRVVAPWEPCESRGFGQQGSGPLCVDSTRHVFQCHAMSSHAYAATSCGDTVMIRFATEKPGSRDLGNSPTRVRALEGGALRPSCLAADPGFWERLRLFKLGGPTGARCARRCAASPSCAYPLKMVFFG